MPDIGWVDPDGELLPEVWPEVVDLSDELRDFYLEIGHDQCVDYLPYTTDGDGVEHPVIPDPVPARFRAAQIAQAKAVHDAGILPNGAEPEGPGVTTFPRDWHVRNLLRPRRVGRVL